MDSRRYNNENEPPRGVEINPFQNRHPVAPTFYHPAHVTSSSLPPNLTHGSQSHTGHRIPMGSVLPQLRHPLNNVSSGLNSLVRKTENVMPAGCYATSYATNTTCSTFVTGNPVSTCQVIPVQVVNQGDTPRSSLSPDESSSNGSPSFPTGSGGSCTGKANIRVKIII